MKGGSKLSFYTIEQWTVKDVASAFKSNTGDQVNRKVVIPIFQRGLRWKKERRTDFIDSLKQGYPFGALLFAKQNAPNTYSVVDGLQRGSTICDFVYNPLDINNISNIDDNILTDIRQALFPDNEIHAINEQIEMIILDYFNEKKTFDKLDNHELSEKIFNKIPTEQDKWECSQKINNALKPYLNEKKAIYENICSSAVPIIVYSGPNELLNDIFNRINVKGIPLNNYEIYAAIWNTNKKVINKTEIVQKVVSKYVTLHENGYTIDGFNPIDMLTKKELTAFEYLFGLGKYWYDQFDCLKVEKESKEDEVNEVAFEIIDACINDSKNIANLDSTLYELNVNKLQRRIEEAIKFVSESIAVIGNFKGNNRALKVLHSKYQIISLISYTFREMYDLNNLDNKKSHWDSNKENYAKLILSHYVADIISNEWHDGGGNKVYSTIREKRYNEIITKQYWETLLDSYYQSQLANGQRERFSNPTNADSVILNCIYVNIFTANDQLSSKFFDIEHLATKERMRSLMKPIEGLKLPISCIANLCYLPEDINRGKREKTIYEATKLSMTIEEIEERFSFTKNNDFSWIYTSYSQENANSLKNSYFQFLDNRYLNIKKRFLSMFGY